MEGEGYVPRRRVSLKQAAAFIRFLDQMQPDIPEPVRAGESSLNLGESSLGVLPPPALTSTRVTGKSMQ